MRPASLFGGLALSALVTLAGAARAEPYDAVIGAETDVRCGHGDGPMFYPTNHLHVGDRVRVVQDEDGGWLAITPPSGSFSWIRKDALFIDNRQQPPVTVVNTETADVRIGSALTKEPPLVIGKRVARGTIITPLPNYVEKTDGEGTWVPIYPPDGELRYIRADAVRQPATPAKTTAVVSVPPAAAPPVAGNPPPGQDADSLYRQAVEAEKWNPQQAIALYTQGANCDANADRRIQALNRAEWLRENLRNPTPNIVPGVDVRTTAAPVSESKVYPPPADPASVHLSAPQGPGTPAASTSSAAPAPGAANEFSTKPGWLQASGRAVEGRKTYIMVSDRGVPFYYVTAQPGVNLDAYLKRRVECYGEAVYNGDLRANYMRVSRVEAREGQ